VVNFFVKDTFELPVDVFVLNSLQNKANGQLKYNLDMVNGFFRMILSSPFRQIRHISYYISLPVSRGQY
jgi:hypothetical protein